MHAAPTRPARRRATLRSQDQRRERSRSERELGDRLLQFLAGFVSLRTRFLEVGAGDCALALKVSDIAEHVVAIDACNRIGPAIERPCNFELVLADGCGIAVPSGSIDVAFSNQVIEHLRPEDAREHLRNIFRALAPGGTYVCITPNRLYGQHDVSGCFDEVATGVHLREYSAREIRELLLGAGFEHVDFYFGARGWFTRCPEWIMAGLEALLDALPAAAGRRIADTALLRAFLGLRVAATKPGASTRRETP